MSDTKVCGRNRKVGIRLHGRGNSNSHGARPVYFNYLDDQVDSDQQVGNKELFLCVGADTSGGGLGRRRSTGTTLASALALQPTLARGGSLQGYLAYPASSQAKRLKF